MYPANPSQVWVPMPMVQKNATTIEMMSDAIFMAMPPGVTYGRFHSGCLSARRMDEMLDNA